MLKAQTQETINEEVQGLDRGRSMVRPASARAPALLRNERVFDQPSVRQPIPWERARRLVCQLQQSPICGVGEDGV